MALMYWKLLSKPLPDLPQNPTSFSRAFCRLQFMPVLRSYSHVLRDSRPRLSNMRMPCPRTIWEETCPKMYHRASQKYHA